MLCGEQGVYNWNGEWGSASYSGWVSFPLGLQLHVCPSVWYYFRNLKNLFPFHHLFSFLSFSLEIAVYQCFLQPTFAIVLYITNFCQFGGYKWHLTLVSFCISLINKMNEHFFGHVFSSSMKCLFVLFNHFSTCLSFSSWFVGILYNFRLLFLFVCVANILSQHVLSFHISIVSLDHSFSTTHYWHFGLDNSLSWGLSFENFCKWILHVRMFSSIPGLCPLDGSSPPFPSCDKQKCHHTLQMYPVGWITPSWEPLL